MPIYRSVFISLRKTRTTHFGCLPMRPCRAARGPVLANQRQPPEAAMGLPLSSLYVSFVSIFSDQKPPKLDPSSSKKTSQICPTSFQQSPPHRQPVVAGRTAQVVATLRRWRTTLAAPVPSPSSSPYLLLHLSTSAFPFSSNRSVPSLFIAYCARPPPARPLPPLALLRPPFPLLCTAPISRSCNSPLYLAVRRE